MPPLSKVKVKERLAAAHQKNIAAFFRQQGAITVRMLNRRTLSLAPTRHREYRELETPAMNISTEEWDRIWSGVVKQTTEQLKTVIASAEADGLHAGANNFKVAIVGVDPSKKAGTTFNLANPRAVAWFQQNGGSVDYIKGIQDTTGKQIKTVIETAIKEGKSYGQLEKEIRDEFDEYAAKYPGKQLSRSQLIATNEIGKAYEEGNMQFAQGLKDDGVVMEKMWMTSHDDRVSDGCEENEGDGWIGIDEVHNSGDDQPPRFPGCRCYEVYREAQA